MDKYLDQYQEALISVAVFLFFISAVALPLLITYFTREFKKRLKRLDEALTIIEETNKYYESDEQKGS